jgi:hypothetical protein
MMKDTLIVAGSLLLAGTLIPAVGHFRSSHAAASCAGASVGPCMVLMGRG